MGVRVAKFGGTSLASAELFQKVKQIVLSDARRRYVVPSAPGRQNGNDSKITDMFFDCYRRYCQGLDYTYIFDKIRNRYQVIVEHLSLNLDINSHLDQIHSQMASNICQDYIISRGEYLCGLIMAEYLDYDFIDAKDIIRFDQHGQLDLAATEQLMCSRLKNYHQAVIPGFYGAMPNGEIKTFSRGGSDITGAIVALCVKAELYENWTDVNGFFMADPKIVPSSKQISLITYSELRELAYNGANVLHEDAIYPVSQAGIPINIRNTNNPHDVGTMIVKTNTELYHRDITGIAGLKDFVIISIEKALMNSEIGFVRRLLSILEDLKINFAHLPSGIDIVSLVILASELEGKLEQVLTLIDEQLHPDKVEVFHNIALIATVGQAMAYKSGIAAKLFGALAQEEINVRMIDQGSSEINILVGIENRDFERAIQAIYRAFVD